MPSSESRLGLQGKESGSDGPRVVAWEGGLPCRPVPRGSVISGCSPGQVCRDTPEGSQPPPCSRGNRGPEKAGSLGLSTGGGTQASWVPGWLPVHRGSPTAAPWKSCDPRLLFPAWQWSVRVRQTCGAGTGVPLLAWGSWGTWPWLRNVRGGFLRQRQVGGCEVRRSSQAQERPSLAPRARLLRSLERGMDAGPPGSGPRSLQADGRGRWQHLPGVELVGEVGCQECFLSWRGGGT